MSRVTRGELLRRLVEGGSITSEQADRVERAPRWSLSVRDVVLLLGALIVLAGLVIVGVQLMQEMPALAVSATLALLGAGVAVAAGQLHRHDRRWWSEVTELPAVVLLAWSAGLLADQAMADGARAALATGVLCAGYGLIRCRRTRATGALVLLGGLAVGFTAAVEAFHLDRVASSLVAWALAIVLLLLSREEPSAARLLEKGAALLAGVTAAIWSTQHDALLPQLPVVATTVVLLVEGARRSSVLLLASGCVTGCVLVVSQAVGRFDAMVAGGVIVSCGGVIAAAAFLLHRTHR